MAVPEQREGFKTSLIGFNKTDVLACIDALSAQARQQQEQLRAS